MKEKQCYNKFNADFKNGTHQKKKKNLFLKQQQKIDISHKCNIEQGKSQTKDSITVLFNLYEVQNR